MITVAFRADASRDIGTGHIMRCLTLANRLVASGKADCHFLTREHPGNLLQRCRDAGHTVHVLPPGSAGGSQVGVSSSPLEHSSWLGVSQDEDAKQSVECLSSIQPDWLVVDHYALDSRWESTVRPHCDRIMVIDDLADRPHDCDLLLDQTHAREATQYQDLLPPQCELLLGCEFALLRPEFAAMRDHSLQRRGTQNLSQLLVNMGGVDKDNVTETVLTVLQTAPMGDDLLVKVVMGQQAPWKDAVLNCAQSMPVSTEVLFDVENMAALMAESDLAIGAAGATSWERCCLGVPTLITVTAMNQRTIAAALCRVGAAVEFDALKPETLISPLTSLLDQEARLAMSEAASRLVDGLGADRIASRVLG